MNKVVNLTRSFHISSNLCGKKNFRKFLLYGKRGTREFKQRMKDEQYSDITKWHDRGIRDVGIFEGKKFVYVPEMIPELIVPDLEGFKLKPYVSYRTPDVVQDEFTPQDLFHAVYSQKITNDFANGKLDEEGNPLEPSPEEQLTPVEAKRLAGIPGADIFESPVSPKEDQFQ